MVFKDKPRLDLAQKVLPLPLYECLAYFFQRKIPGLVLVGGTALNGFYAGHRRSDDLDIFAKDEDAQKAGVLVAKSLSSLGIKISYEFQTPEYYKATCESKGHLFTIDIVLDPYFFKVAEFEILSNGICVASLESIFMTKAATLVSRCGEKDLYDLFWIFQHNPTLDFKQLIEYGQKIDGGVNGETMLLSISGTKLRKEACGFGISAEENEEEIYKTLLDFQKWLIHSLLLFLKNEPPPPLKTVIQKIQKFKK